MTYFIITSIYKKLHFYRTKKQLYGSNVFSLTSLLLIKGAADIIVVFMYIIIRLNNNKGRVRKMGLYEAPWQSVANDHLIFCFHWTLTCTDCSTRKFNITSCRYACINIQAISHTRTIYKLYLISNTTLMYAILLCYTYYDVD